MFIEFVTDIRSGAKMTRIQSTLEQNTIDPAPAFVGIEIYINSAFDQALNALEGALNDAALYYGEQNFVAPALTAIREQHDDFINRCQEKRIEEHLATLGGSRLVR